MDREEILSKLTTWSIEMELPVTSIQDPSADFHLTISEPNLPIIDVVHPKTDSKYIILATRITVSEDDQEKMLNLAFQQRQELLWDIRLKLLSANVEFRMLRPEGPTSWEIHTKVFLEGMNTQLFSDAYVKIKNAALSVIWSYRRILDLRKHRM